MSELEIRKFKTELICAIIIVAAAGITYFVSEFSVSNTTKEAAAVFNTKVESIVPTKVNGTAVNNATQTKVNGNTLVFSATLPTQGDSITYLVTVKNDGNIDAYTSGLTEGKFINGTQKTDIYPLSAEYDGLTLDEVIKAGETKTFTVTLSYGKGGNLTNSTLTYTLLLKFIQK